MFQPKSLRVAMCVPAAQIPFLAAVPHIINISWSIQAAPPPSRQVAKHGLPLRRPMAKPITTPFQVILARAAPPRSRATARLINQRPTQTAQRITTTLPPPVPTTARSISRNVKPGRRVRIQTAIPFITPSRLCLAHLACWQLAEQAATNTPQRMIPMV